MGYLFIMLAVFFNVVKGYSSKKVSTSLDATQKNLSFNTQRLLISFLFALIISCCSENEGVFLPNPIELVICLVAGVCMAGFACLWQMIIRSKAYMLASASSSASFVIPFICGLLFWKEKLTVFKGTAIVLIVASLFFLLKFDSKLNGKIGGKELFYLALLLISQGVMQSAQKMFALHVPGKTSISYNFYMFLFAFLAAALFSIINKSTRKETFIKNEGKAKKNSNIKFKQLMYMIIMAGALFAVSYFQTSAAKTVDAVILYPLLSALSLVAGSVMSVVCFREKMDKNGIVGIVLVVFAVVFSKL